MTIIITIATSVASAMLVFLLQSTLKEVKKLKAEKEEEEHSRNKAIENGVRQLLSVRLEEIYDMYADSETIPRRVYDRWMKMHNAYKGLHGNGTFERMKEEFERKHII